MSDPLATADFYQRLGCGVLDTGPLDAEHPLLIITHDGKPSLMIQGQESLRELLPAMRPVNGCSGIHYFTVADFDATVERIRPLVDVVKDTVPNHDRTGREFFFRDPNGHLIGVTQKTRR
ncbi:VOC family protein [Streptomyces sp. x-19]|uniref:VOC family protein n=1 Tax=Streptomyces sp. x-19 TaxID=2789280 RepID=UPI00397F3CDA